MFEAKEICGETKYSEDIFQVFRKPRSAGYSTGPGLGSREDLTFWWGPNKVSGILETVDQK